MAQNFQRLLLATERTEFDTGAERLALAMAQRCGRPLAVVMPLAGNPEFEAVAPELAERADRQAAAKLAPLYEQARSAGVEIDVAVRHGPEASREIVDDARERAADVVVIRRRGRRSFLAQLMVGEMVGQVVAHAPCNVLVVPRDAAMWTRRVLVAVEPDARGRQLMALAATVAAECALPLSAVCVISADTPAQRRPAEAFLAEGQRIAGQQGVAVDAEVLSGAPAAQILDAARRQAADLIVMGVSGSWHLGRAVVGRVAHEVTGRFDGAVLLARFSNSQKDASS